MGQWQSGESRPGDDAKEVSWVNQNELSSYSLFSYINSFWLTILSEISLIS